METGTNGTNGVMKDAQVRPLSPELPILAYAQEIQEAARTHDSLLIIGETGSGKTTRLPLLLREIIGPEDKVAITQPRRVAARAVAKYVADQVGSRIGEEVGYAVRFDDQTTEGTRINFMTDGILLRKIQQDPLLAEYSVVMVDEVHERSLNIDFTLGLLKRLQSQRAVAGMAPLKIVITSATLEKEKLAAYFDGSPVIEIPGRMYAVDVHYEEKPVYDATVAAAEKTRDITTSGKEGDVLIFMPGVDEINKTIANIRQQGVADADILPLHGQLSPEDQDKVFAKGTRRKIIVATNVAETSVTVPGVRYVIDSGLIKQTQFDPQTGIESLTTQSHAQSGCIQRAGRAGRVAPGDCYRLYTEADFNARTPFHLPEIQRSNLAHVVLTMKKVGIDHVESFDFIDRPDTATLHQAVETLKNLGALDAEGVITEIGRVMSELPLEPHIARMVIEAQKHGCVEQVCTIASFLGGRSVLNRPKGSEWQVDGAHKAFRDSSSDFLTFLNVWKSYEANRFNDYWARDNFLNSRTLGEVREIRQQLFRAMGRNNIDLSSNEDSDLIGQSIAAGLVENLMEYRGSHSYRRVKDNVTGFFVHPSSVLFGSDARLVAPAEIVKTSKTFARVCQVVKPEWIPVIAPQLITETPRNVSYDPVSDTVTQVFDVRLNGSIDSFPAVKREVVGEDAVTAFADALASGKVEIKFTQDNLDVLKTATDLYVRSGGQIPKPLATQQLAEMYRARLGSISSRAALETAITAGEFDVQIQLNEYVTPEVQQNILTDNPDTITLNGISYQLRYSNIEVSGNPFPIQVSIPLDQVILLQDMPRVPSGRPIRVNVIDKIGSPFHQFAGTDIASLKKRSRDLLVNAQWNEWVRIHSARILDNFNILTDEVDLPVEVEYTKDPLSGEMLLAYPALRVTYDTWSSSNQYSIAYFPSREQAEEARIKTETHKQSELAKKEIELAAIERIAQAKSLAEEVGVMLREITDANYLAFGFDQYDYDMLKRSVKYASDRTELDSKGALRELTELKAKLLRAHEIKAGIYYPKQESELVPTITLRETSDASGQPHTATPSSEPRKVGPNKNEQNRAVWESLLTVEDDELIELASSGSPKDLRVAELATVRVINSMSWRQLKRVMPQIDTKFPYFAGAIRRMTSLSEAITSMCVTDENSVRIIAEADQFTVLKQAYIIAQHFMDEWIGSSPDLQNKAFEAFIAKLAVVQKENPEITQALSSLRADQPVPQILEDVFIKAVENL